MKITLQLPDELAEHYESLGRKNEGLAGVLVRQLERWQGVPPDTKVLVVLPEDRAALEVVTGGMPLQSLKQLLERVRELASVKLGPVVLPWTAAQYAELKARALRLGVDPKVYAEQVVHQIQEQFFSTVPRDEELRLRQEDQQRRQAVTDRSART